jgi:hypothetical protein
LAVGIFQIKEQPDAQRATSDGWTWLAGKPLGASPVKKECSEMVNGVEEDPKPAQAGRGGEPCKHCFLFSFSWKTKLFAALLLLF